MLMKVHAKSLEVIHLLPEAYQVQVQMYPSAPNMMAIPLGVALKIKAKTSLKARLMLALC
jgi:hypothetical protein